jgi:hypothetical protein
MLSSPCFHTQLPPGGLQLAYAGMQPAAEGGGAGFGFGGSAAAPSGQGTPVLFPGLGRRQAAAAAGQPPSSVQAPSSGGLVTPGLPPALLQHRHHCTDSATTPPMFLFGGVAGGAAAQPAVAGSETGSPDDEIPAELQPQKCASPTLEGDAGGTGGVPGADGGLAAVGGGKRAFSSSEWVMRVSSFSGPKGKLGHPRDSAAR